MQDKDRTKEQLGAELLKMRQRVAELEQAEIEWQSTAAALRQSEQDLHTMLNSIGDAVIATGTDGAIIRMNPVAERLTGWTQAEAEGKPLSQVFRIFNAQTREKVDNPVSQVVESRETAGLDSHTMLIARDGTEYQIADSVAPILDAEGHITGAVLVFRDVTDAYRAQEKLQESETRLAQNLAELSAIVNALPGIVTVIDTDFNVLVANDEVYRRFGQGGLHEVLGKACFATRKGLDQPCPQCTLLTAFETGETMSRVSTPEEEALMGIATKSYAIPLRDANGVIWGGVEVIIDITDVRKIEKDLRKSQEQMDLALQGADLGLWDWNIRTDEANFNQRWAEMLGYTLAEIEPHFRSWVERVHPDDLPAARKALDAHLGGETPSYRSEQRLLARDGTWRWILSRGKVVEWDDDENPTRATGTHLDITDRKQAEEERLKLRKLESVGVLAGGIAHDFNNLLTAVFGNIAMAKRYLPTDHKSYKFLEYAARSMERATDLTKQLLTFSRGGDPIKETLSIGQAITETARFSILGSSAKLQTEIAPDLWTVEADKGQLGQVISNLIINAQQSMPGGGTITLSAENIETSEGRYVQITVQDEGVGIAPQHLDRIFDPYFTTKQKGSGLGLAVTHSVITKHGGTITVDSTLNQGTTFTIHLPAAQAAEEAIPGKIADKIDGKPVSTAHILVLDDQEAVRKVLGAVLRTMEHHVSYAETGQEAITKYRSAWRNDSPFDAVITDLTIPGGIGGEAVAQEILAIDPQAKIIVSSGYATDSVMANYKAYGFQGRIAKPYNFDDVQQVVEEVLKA